MYQAHLRKHIDIHEMYCVSLHLKIEHHIHWSLLIRMCDLKSLMVVYDMEKLSVGWGPISACNMNCQFCYSRHKRIDSTDLQLENWIDFIDGNHAVIDAINYGTG